MIIVFIWKLFGSVYEIFIILWLAISISRMSNVTQITDSPRHPRRRRSTSLDSKVIIRYRENKIPENQMKHHTTSSSSLFNPDSADLERTNNPKAKIKPNVDSNFYYLFVNWRNDLKSVKPSLMNLSDPSIFKNEFPRHNDLNPKEFYKPLIFLVMNNLKIDNEYEVIYFNFIFINMVDVKSI